MYEEPLAGWEVVRVHNEDGAEWVDRLEVPGGWLYRSHMRVEHSDGTFSAVMAMSWVPYLEP